MYIHDSQNFESRRDLYSSINLSISLRDFNFNFFDYNKNEKATKFLYLSFYYGLVPVIKKPTKPTRVTKNTTTARDYIIKTHYYIEKSIRE